MGLEKNCIIEFVRVGDSVKVSAIDPKTGIETCVITPSHGVTKQRMKELAIRKLNYVINKKKNS